MYTCRNDDECPKDYYCSENHCRRKRFIGKCDRNNMCLTENCDAVCLGVGQKQLGSECIESWECRHDPDDGRPIICLNGKCTTSKFNSLKDYEYCSENKQCKSNNCDISSRQCVPGTGERCEDICSKGNECVNFICQASKGAKECLSSWDCFFGGCEKGKCTDPILGQVCDLENDHCQSGYCIDSVCREKLSENQVSTASKSKDNLGLWNSHYITPLLVAITFCFSVIVLILVLFFFYKYVYVKKRIDATVTSTETRTESSQDPQGEPVIV